MKDHVMYLIIRYLYTMITNKQKNIIIETLKPYKPKQIGIFGSFARGEEKENSDIDILYHFETPISLFTKATIKSTLEDLLHNPVDLVSEKYMHPLMKENILKNMEVIYRNV